MFWSLAYFILLSNKRVENARWLSVVGWHGNVARPKTDPLAHARLVNTKVAAGPLGGHLNLWKVRVA